jgi:TonB-dependent SusC/RagA subfamily outer membrane receptor
MNDILAYLLKAAIIQSVLLLCYRLLMQRDTFHKMIRYYFMGGLLFSYIAPFIRFDFRILPPIQHNIHPVIINVSEIRQYVGQDFQSIPQWWQQYSFTDILTLIFVAGTVFMLICLILQYSSLVRLHICQKHKYQSFSILSVDIPIKPFSYGKRIYINPKLHNPKELDEIIRHELIHIRQYHSVDIIVAAINRSIFWWNPFAWILNGNIRNNLEYIVDNEMLQNGINRKHYQYHLLNINQLVYKNNIANYFNFSNIKKRIKMMNKEKTQPVYKIKWLLLPFVAAVILLSLNVKRAIATNVDFAVISEIIEPELIPEADSLVNSVYGTKGLTGKIVSVKKTNDTVMVMLKVSHDTIVPPVCYDSTVIHSFSIMKDSAVIKIYDEKAKNGVTILTMEENEDVSKPEKITETAEFAIVQSGNPPFIVIDGKESDEEDLQLNVNNIHSISILKGNSAIKQYGEKGKDGVIVVVTKGIGNAVNISDTLFTINQLKIRGLANNDHTPLIIIDGKESNRAELSKLNSDEIHSFSILKDGAATKIYGEKGKNGVIIVETKKI